MARKKKNQTRRGSPEVVAKIMAARALNRLFDDAGDGPPLDGRTLKRKKRMLARLSDGVDGRPLKALEALTHAHELLTLGETLSSLRKLKPKVPGPPPLTDEASALFLETQRLYAFDARAWRLLGVNIEKLENPRTTRQRKKTSSRHR